MGLYITVLYPVLLLSATFSTNSAPLAVTSPCIEAVPATFRFPKFGRRDEVYPLKTPLFTKLGLGPIVKEPEQSIVTAFISPKVG